MHDAYDEGSSSMIVPTQDEDSTPCLIYDVDDEKNVTIPPHDDEIKKYLYQ
jgi:hypothetical protein